jgi:hypothetical protein
MFWDATQPEQDSEEEDEFGIGPGISLGDFESAERHLYDLPPKQPEMDLDDPDFLEQPALSGKDIGLVTKFYTELHRIQMETCDTCNRCWFDLDVHNNQCKVCRADRLYYEKENIP